MVEKTVLRHSKVLLSIHIANSIDIGNYLGIFYEFIMPHFMSLLSLCCSEYNFGYNLNHSDFYIYIYIK